MKCKPDTGRGCCFGCNQDGEPVVSPLDGGSKLNTYDWTGDIPDPMPASDIFEVRFKNTRKGFYQNVNDLPLNVGDVVAVESNPGHDIGIISLGGDMVFKQMRRRGFNPDGVEFRKIYRKAKPYDIEKWQEAIALEHDTMIAARQIAADLNLNMKIGDVEYQGDKIKAIFYYIADERVDFRELIKIFADRFKIRVEMKQIGARQEAGRIGGIGACGRELCCASWITSFASVTTNSARQQEISLNPQKLAGQCSKLKCCMNYEVDTYIDARRDFPRINQPLETLDGSYYLVKQDIFKRLMWFSSDPNAAVSMTAVPVGRVREIISLNRKGVKADRLIEVSTDKPERVLDFHNVVGEESITRFDNGNRPRRGDDRRRNRGNRPSNRTENSDTQTSDVQDKPQERRTGEENGRERRNHNNNRRDNRNRQKPNPQANEGEAQNASSEKKQGQQHGENAQKADNRPNNNRRNNRNRKPRNNNGNGSQNDGSQNG